MTRSRAFLIVLVAILVPIMLATAQRGRKVQSADSEEGNGAALMNNMQATCNMLATDFDALNHHFEILMDIENPDLLEAEMGLHKELMQKLYETITEQKKYCDQVTNLENGQMEERGRGRGR